MNRLERLEFLAKEIKSAKSEEKFEKLVDFKNECSLGILWGSQDPLSQDEYAAFNAWAVSELKKLSRSTRAVIKAAGLTQKKAAALIGMPSRTLEDWLTGKREPSEWVERLVVEKLLRECEVTAFKSVNILDLPSILEKGILPLDECKNENWENGKRASNATNVVYLAMPTSEINAYTQYGAALIECKASGLSYSEMNEQDINLGQYVEVTADRILPSQITAVYLPAAFKERATEFLPADVLKKIKWCSLEFKVFDENEHRYRFATADEIEKFSKTCELDTQKYCFFRSFFKENEKDREISPVQVRYDLKNSKKSKKV